MAKANQKFQHPMSRDRFYSHFFKSRIVNPTTKQLREYKETKRKRLRNEQKRINKAKFSKQRREGRLAKKARNKPDSAKRQQQIDNGYELAKKMMERD